MKNKFLMLSAILLFCAIFSLGCKTGKGCDCPTFGEQQTNKEHRF